MFDPAAGNNSALLITEQVLVFAVFVGSVAALPAFIEFITEMRKRKERIDLSLEDEVAELSAAEGRGHGRSAHQHRGPD